MHSTTQYTAASTRPAGSPSPSLGAASSLSEHIDQNVEGMVALRKRQWDTVGLTQRLVERIGRFLGRPAYLIGLLIVIGFWIGANLVKRTTLFGWDPPPFGLLDGAMTLISLITTTIVLITQNRQTKLEQQHTHLGLQVSLLTEQKVTKLINLIEELRRDLPMVKNRHDAHAQALQESASTADVLAAIEGLEASPSQGTPTKE